MENNKIYEERAKRKSISGLKLILTHKNLYDERLIIAVSKELENRRSINMNFERRTFFNRIIKSIVLTFSLTILLFGIFVIIKEQKFDFLEILIVLAIASIFTFFGLIGNLIRERYYLLKIKADNEIIEIHYLYYESDVHFKSKIKDVEIIYKTTLNRFPTPILIIKYKGKRVIKLYSGVNKGLSSDELDVLIDDLREFKDASH